LALTLLYPPFSLLCFILAFFCSATFFPLF
jgi:hypothetical protein